MLWAGERAALRSFKTAACASAQRPLLAGRSVFLWRNHTRKRIERAFKKERGRATLVYMLLVSRQVPVSQQYWRKRIGPSLADRSRVELALLPRLSLTRLSRTQSLFLFGGSFVLHSLAITCRERSNQGAYYHIERSKRSESHRVAPTCQRADR